MRTCHRAGVALLCLPAVVATVLTTAPVAAAEGPAVTVTPSAGLAGGDAVSVAATGLPPGTEVGVVQCDDVADPSVDGCPVLAAVPADATGGVAATVTLGDPVPHFHEFGDATPVYCRADVCRVFVTWTDGYGGFHAVASEPLEFTGSPATIEASPSTGLRAKQWVRVRGTAFGAEGRTVVVVEESCFAIVQGSGCYGERLLGTATVATDGSYALRVRATRHLADGTDCADPGILGACQLTARVLDAAGQPDDSFGVSRVGDPGAVLTFRG